MAGRDTDRYLQLNVVQRCGAVDTHNNANPLELSAHMSCMQDACVASHM